jgi:transcriptional repressor NrdR
MRCPACGHLEDRVVDSREAQEGHATRRRRECLGCGRRFTTYERIEESLPLVVKKDGRREAFDRRKIVEGLRRACQKRPVSEERIEELVSEVERAVQERGEREVAATVVGEAVMRRLKELDPVAYVRFASVYRAFQDVGDFTAAVAGLRSASFDSAAPSRGYAQDRPASEPAEGEGEGRAPAKRR